MNLFVFLSLTGVQWMHTMGTWRPSCSYCRAGEGAVCPVLACAHGVLQHRPHRTHACPQDGRAHARHCVTAALEHSTVQHHPPPSSHAPTLCCAGRSLSSSAACTTALHRLATRVCVRCAVLCLLASCTVHCRVCRAEHCAQSDALCAGCLCHVRAQWRTRARLTCVSAGASERRPCPARLRRRCLCRSKKWITSTSTAHTRASSYSTSTSCLRRLTAGVLCHVFLSFPFLPHHLHH